MSEDRDYEQWLEQRRSVRPTSELANRIMRSVDSRETVIRVSLPVRAGLWIEQSRLTRIAACLTALVIGSTPFVFLAYAAQLIAF